WIDYNNNMIFDTDELVAEHTNLTAIGTFTGTINLPATIDDGNYRIRVRSRYYLNSTANPCGAMEYGETEDYTLTVIPVPDCMPPSGLTSTAPSLTSIELSWTSSGTLFDIEYGAPGFTQGTGTLVEGVTNPYLIDGLPTGIYDFYVRQDCTDDNDGYSLWAGPASFGIGFYSGGDIPTKFGTPPSSAAPTCSPEPVLTIEVP